MLYLYDVLKNIGMTLEILIGISIIGLIAALIMAVNEWSGAHNFGKQFYALLVLSTFIRIFIPNDDTIKIWQKAEINKVVPTNNELSDYEYQQFKSLKGEQ